MSRHRLLLMELFPRRRVYTGIASPTSTIHNGYAGLSKVLAFEELADAKRADAKRAVTGTV